MNCPECHRPNPEVAQFCFACGHALRRTDGSKHGRKNSYAVQSSEGVGQLALISTIMPHSNRKTADGYRWSLILTGALVLIFNMIGFLPAALLAAAFVVPVTYLVYIYDANVWEDTPLPVVAGLFLVTGVLSTVISLIFFHWVFEGSFLSLLAGKSGISGMPVGALLIFAVLLPIVAEVAKNAGAIWLARKPLFDDMIDALTFGIAAGTAYAAFETVIAFGDVFRTGSVQNSESVLSWLVIILNLMIVKSVIYGTATGIAVAAFSGRGEGFDGFTGKYFSKFALAVGANIAYWLGIRLLSYAPWGDGLGLLWGALIAAFLVLRVRSYMQEALLEAAVEDAAADRRHKYATTGGGFCPECEMPLLPDAMFCIACGTSVRATTSFARAHVRRESLATVEVADGNFKPQQADMGFEASLAKLDRTKTAALIGAIVVLLAGVGAFAGLALGEDTPLEVGVIGEDGRLGPEENSVRDGLGAPRRAFAGEGTLAAGPLLAQLDPSPLPTETVPSPGETGIPPAPSPAPVPGTGVSLGGVVNFDVPPPWEFAGQNEAGTQFDFQDGRNNWLWTGLFTGDPAGDAGAVLGSNFQNFLLMDNYSNLQTGEVVAMQPFGSITSMAAIPFQGLWTDSQGSMEMMGNIWLAIRADGQVLVLTGETTPPDDFLPSIPEFAPLWENAFNAFAGTV